MCDFNLAFLSRVLLMLGLANKLNVDMLNVIKLSVVNLSVAAPFLSFLV